ncbi:hypothetical protein HDU67_007177 [Dinochytrium kinnereticum]|nr:hypothetical protein HDU67_007177 [Dinochytrium kinnereticum]
MALDRRRHPLFLPPEIWSKVLSHVHSLQDFHSLCSAHRLLYHAFGSIRDIVPLVLRISRMGRFSTPSSHSPTSMDICDSTSMYSMDSTGQPSDTVVDAQTAMAIICLKHPWPQGPEFEMQMADFFLSQLDHHNIPAKRALALAAVRCHLPILTLFSSRPAFRQPLRVILYQAAMQSEFETVVAILRAWRDMEEVATVVYAISQFGEHSVLGCMLDHGAWSVDALGLACVERCDDLVSMFLDHVPIVLSPEDRNYAFLVACQQGHIAACGRLLEMGADPRCENDLPLMITCRSGNIQLLHQLIHTFSPGEEVERVALAVAERENMQDVVAFFESRGITASGTLDGAFGETHLDEIVQTSLTPLSIAARLPSSSSVAKLLASGANPHSQEGQALVEASKLGSAETVRILLQAGVNPSSRDDEALIAACYRVIKPITSSCIASLDSFDGLQVVRLLLKHGSSPSARDGLPIKLARSLQSSGALSICHASLIRALENAVRVEDGMEDFDASAQYEDELMEFQMEHYGQ